MKLSKIYSNKPLLFLPIEFNEGLNVIYAEVTKPEEKTKDSHNLGKTLLIHLIDFMLLKNLRKGHFLYDNKQLFDEFSFFLEVKSNSGEFITIRRDVSQASKIWIHQHKDGKQDFSSLSDELWKHQNLAFNKGKQTLNRLLGLSTIDPWSYRKGCGYFLRTQSDYRDVFQLAKFTAGTHKDWKPFLAKILGFDDKLIQKKYAKDDEKKELEKSRELSRDLTSVELNEYDRVKGALEIKRSEFKESSEAVERFNFYRSDLDLNTELLEKIEKNISVLNDRRYTISYEIDKIRESIQARTIFDIQAVSKLFREAGVAFPEAIKKDYEDLLNFNTRISEERNSRLEEQRNTLLSEQTKINQELTQLNTKREELLDVLQDSDTLNKYRKLQKTLTNLEASIAKLEVELQQLDKVSVLGKKIQGVVRERAELVGEIVDAVNAGNDRYSNVRAEFNRIIKKVINVPAVLSIVINKEGNLEFEASLMKSETNLVPTSEDKGNTYRQLLCSAFDLSLLSVYSEESFYRFVYHDGILESLDERKKVQLLEIIRELCDVKGVQYIMTLIDADVPRDENDERIPFNEGEIVLNLHDGSDKGRLFRMEKF